MPSTTESTFVTVCTDTYCRCPHFGGNYQHKDSCVYSWDYDPNPKPTPKAGTRAWRKYHRYIKEKSNE